MPEIIDGLSMSLEQTNMDKLRAVFPECFAEGKLDIDKLLSLCGEYIDNDFEEYKFEWKGKAECLKLYKTGDGSLSYRTANVQARQRTVPCLFRSNENTYTLRR